MTSGRVAWLLVAGLTASGCSADEGSIDSESQGVRYGSPAGAAYEGVVGLLDSEGYLCTGVVFGPRNILTAGHCVDNPITHYHIGGTWRLISDYGGQTIRRHPQYQPNLDGVDLATIRTGVNLNLPVRRFATINPTLGETFRVVGYGFDQTGDLGNRNAGASVFVESSPASGAVHYGGSLLMLVPNELNQLPCRGDSGSPLLNASDEIVGILSFGDDAPCASAGWVAYTHVHPYAAWIQPKPVPSVNQNTRHRFDVNRDGWISNVDVMIINADLRNNGGRQLTTFTGNFIDVNGDGYATNLDSIETQSYLRYINNTGGF